MTKRVIPLLLSIAMLFSLCSCASVLDGETLSVTPHTEPTDINSSGSKPIEADSYDELRSDVIGFIWKHEETGLIRVSGYSGDITADVGKVCDDVLQNVPVGSYAASEIKGTATKIMSYYEVVIEISYKHTKSQTDGIITVSTLRYLKSELLDMLDNYKEYCVIQTNFGDIAADDVSQEIQQIYYENPLSIVILPIATVNVYPQNGTGSDRILEITLGNRYETSTLRAMGSSLTAAVQNVAKSAGGDSDGAILLSLCKKLIDTTKYDSETASGGYSTQNIAATAYGALVNGSAVSEGYAMAYKALCDELGLECYVVVGKLGGAAHAWNIVAIDGKYYHVDSAMCDVNGIETAFLKSDKDMTRNKYTWDTAQYKVCSGTLAYADFAGGASG